MKYIYRYIYIYTHFIIIDFLNMIALLLLDHTRRCQTTISIGGEKYKGAATRSTPDER